MEKGEGEPRKSVRRIVNYPPNLADYEDQVADHNGVPRADVARYGLRLMQLIGRYFIENNPDGSMIRILNPITREPEAVFLTLDLDIPPDYVLGQHQTKPIEHRDLTEEQQPPNAD